jgi:hypothetical protein
MIKHLITGGCSFSHSQTPTENWIGFLENHLKEQNKELTIEHTGFLSQGQELIQKKAMLAAMDAMDRGISPSDILITVMWSGSYRKAWYIDNLYILNKMRKDWKNFEGGMSGQFLDLKNRLIGDTETFQTKNGSEFNSAKYGGWYFTVNGSDSQLEFVQQHYLLDGDMTNGVGKVHTSIENMIMLQNFCKLHNIKFIHQFFMDSSYLDIEKHKEHQLINYLYNQLDTDIMLKNGMFEYLHTLLNIPREESINVTHADRKQLDEQYGYFSKDGFHPSTYGAELWTKNILIPFLETKKYI